MLFQSNIQNARNTFLQITADTEFTTSTDSMSAGEIGPIPELIMLPLMRIKGAFPFNIFTDEVLASDMMAGISCKALNGLLIFFASDDR